MIQYNNLIPGSRWIDDKGREWELLHRNARGHSHTFARPGYRGKIGHYDLKRHEYVGRGSNWQWASEVRMNMDGWRAA